MTLNLTYINTVVVKSMGKSKTNMWQALYATILLTLITPPGFASKGLIFIERGLPQETGQALIDSDSTTKKARLLFFGLGYGNNSSFLGRYQTEVLPYYSADISYKSKTGLWLSLLAYDINHSNSFIDEVDAMAGWSKDLSTHVDASLFYTRYFFTDSNESIKASVANTATGSLGLDWGFLYSKMSGHYIFGATHDFFLVIENSRYVEFPAIFHKDDYLSFDPKISIISGTQTFVDTHYLNRGTPLIDSPGGGPSPPRGKPGSGSGSPTTSESLETTFNILSYEFILPVSYTTRKFSFEISGRYSIPVNLLEGDISIPQFFFTGGLVYYISSN
jgi:hypothetical protein